jgi:hypothetical protein
MQKVTLEIKMSKKAGYTSRYLLAVLVLPVMQTGEVFFFAAILVINIGSTCA